MSRSIGIALVAMVLATGCSSIEGTRDKSRTAQRLVDLGPRGTIAVLPVKENAAVEGLSEMVAAALPLSLSRQLPQMNIDGPQTTTARLIGRDVLGTYSQWASTYEMTSVLDLRPLAEFREAVKADYLLVVRSLSLGRERIRAAEAGYTGLVSDANNIWRTDLKISAVLISLDSEQVVWKGEGRAENINSPRKTLDYGIVLINQRNPEMIEYVGKMVSVAADGLARQIAGRPADSSRK